jgi:hypothetical protein
VVLEPLLIIGISSGSYSKITYSYNSHTNYNSLIVHTQSQITYKHIHKFTNRINIDIVIYNLQHISSCIICISSSVVQPIQDHISPIYIYNIKVIQQKISASRAEEGEALDHPWRTTSSMSGHP